ncbi:hypothetical protein [Brevibacterium pigmentatum]|uniref:hypothetical protein n=1 Tax=Brevibacterium pigmentatum TaxID=1496080 RepID=UPI00224BA7A7|nr:hypothetical protein [Brevibacterium pigmentatum]
MPLPDTAAPFATFVELIGGVLLILGALAAGTLLIAAAGPHRDDPIPVRARMPFTAAGHPLRHGRQKSIENFGYISGLHDLLCN